MMSGIVSAVYNVPVGEVWPIEGIQAVRDAAAHGLEFAVVESVPVHEDIKQGKSTRDRLINNYCENIRRLGGIGIKVICYNFMPVFDWLRSDLARPMPDGSNALAYDHEAILSMDPAAGELSLPGWDESYAKAELRNLLAGYEGIDEEALWKNFAYFLERIIPAAEEAGVNMAIHPDDPPWSVFSLPRIITGGESYARMKEICPSTVNGITLCLGSLGASPNNDIAQIAQDYADRIHFVHARNIKRTGEWSFQESPHPTTCGSLDMYSILKVLYKAGFDGYIRPDHGRMIWEETGRPGYGLYDRALGAAYLTGLWEALEKEAK